MTTKSGGDGKLPPPVMNVTPLVDVVLVLLIIFIVITPQLNGIEHHLGHPGTSLPLLRPVL